MTQNSYEINFDGLVGPTHNYSGLSWGNLASLENKEAISNPQAAALQGLEKMWHLAQLGVKQAVLPPHERPHLPTLRQVGFSGSPPEILSSAFQNSPEILFACSSAAAMWTANAATITPSIDTYDSRLHITPANLISFLHRSLETSVTERIFKAIFPPSRSFIVHPPLPLTSTFADEGAANHIRFCRTHGEPGVHFFVYGRSSYRAFFQTPKKYPARQTLEASRTLAFRHRLSPQQMVFAQQNPEATDAGVFHNDVISTGNHHFFLFHEKAFVNSPAVIEELQRKVKEVCDVPFITHEIKESAISLKEVVASYLFNSQIVSLPNQTVVMIAPEECRHLPEIHDYLMEMVHSDANPLREVHYFNLRESMRNGGGPACLRCRVVVTEQELSSLNPHVFLTETLYEALKKWIYRHYRSQLIPKDLADPQLLEETYTALNALTELLHLGSIYDFQRT